MPVTYEWSWSEYFWKLQKRCPLEEVVDEDNCEAIYHFNLYRYLYDLLKTRGVEVIPQFPTGNGKIDLILKYREQIYALELKSFKNIYTFEKGIEKAAEYGRQIGHKEVFFLVFVELTEEEAKQLEKEVEKDGIKVISIPIAIL